MSEAAVDVEKFLSVLETDTRRKNEKDKLKEDKDKLKEEKDKLKGKVEAAVKGKEVAIADKVDTEMHLGFITDKAKQNLSQCLEEKEKLVEVNNILKEERKLLKNEVIRLRKKEKDSESVQLLTKNTAEIKELMDQNANLISLNKKLMGETDGLKMQNEALGASVVRLQRLQRPNKGLLDPFVGGGQKHLRKRTRGRRKKRTKKRTKKRNQNDRM